MRDFDSYRERYRHLKLERDEAGVLTVTLHSDGGPLLWGMEPNREVAECLADISADSGNQVVILTGTGDQFIGAIDYRPVRGPDRTFPAKWASGRAGATMLDHMLAISCPVIAAVNGPARVHSELAVLCDIVLAADTALFQDAPHFPAGLVPGDGVHVIWPMLLGPNRGRYFLLTGQEIGAEEALRLGVVSEVLPGEDLMPRARALAALLLKQPELVRRHTRTLLARSLKRAMHDELELGHALELHAWSAYGPPADIVP